MLKLCLKFPSLQIKWNSNSLDFMPSHIKHMHKTHKISVISNSPLFQFCWLSFIVQNFILKNSKFHRLAWNCPQHIFKSNNLASDKQLAYRVGDSTALLIIHLTGLWRRAVDSGMAVATVFIEFKKSIWPNMQLSQWNTTIYCAKWCKVGFVTYVDGDPTYPWMTIVLSYDWKNRIIIV